MRFLHLFTHRLGRRALAPLTASSAPAGADAPAYRVTHLSVLCERTALGDLRARLQTHLTDAGLQLVQTKVTDRSDSEPAQICLSIRFHNGQHQALMAAAQCITAEASVVHARFGMIHEPTPALVN